MLAHRYYTPVHHSATAVPETQGVKYAGSKLKLLPSILRLVQQVKPRTVIDGFAGTTRVAQALAKSGYRVIANDIAVWSEVFGTCYLLNDRPPEYYQPLLDHLNALAGTDGWFTEHYGGDLHRGGLADDDRLKKPWQKHNTRRLDAIRDEIERLALPRVEKAVVLASLMLALDEVDSTLGHFVSYLNGWSARSHKPLLLKLPKLIYPAQPDFHKVLRGDIFACLPTVEADLAYFDPPYGSNNEKMPPSRVRYAAYYHLWTTVCQHDHPPLFGKAGRRADSSDKVAASEFEEFRKNAANRFIALDAIDRLLRATRARYILLSYSSGGRATAEQLQAIIASVGRVVELMKIDYRKNVMAEMRWTNQWTANVAASHQEFLFLIEKTD